MSATRLLNPDEVACAVEILQQGGVVAVPTETVYGLAANAEDANAVTKIFQAKERPSRNPLIVHVASFEQCLRFASIEQSWIDSCIKRFTPGPLSFVLPYRGGLAPAVTAGLSTVAVRVPAHPTLREILQQSQIALAAPSANRSGRPSATTWQAVQEDLSGRIDAIICDEACRFGVESTVIDATGPYPIILRAGGITLEELQSIVPEARVMENASDLKSRSPGTRFRHYQPQAKVFVVNELRELDVAVSPVAVIGLRTFFESPDAHKQISLECRCNSLDEYARSLFSFYRQADASGARSIVCQRVPATGIGAAIMDRIERASSVDT